MMPFTYFTSFYALVGHWWERCDGGIGISRRWMGGKDLWIVNNEDGTTVGWR
jgi:hypothetical protein